MKLRSLLILFAAAGCGLQPPSFLNPGPGGLGGKSANFGLVQFNIKIDSLVALYPVTQTGDADAKLLTQEFDLDGAIVAVSIVPKLCKTDHITYVESSNPKTPAAAKAKKKMLDDLAKAKDTFNQSPPAHVDISDYARRLATTGVVTCGESIQFTYGPESSINGWVVDPSWVGLERSWAPLGGEVWVYRKKFIRDKGLRSNIFTLMKWENYFSPPFNIENIWTGTTDDAHAYSTMYVEYSEKISKVRVEGQEKELTEQGIISYTDVGDFIVEAAFHHILGYPRDVDSNTINAWVNRMLTSVRFIKAKD